MKIINRFVKSHILSRGIVDSGIEISLIEGKLSAPTTKITRNRQVFCVNFDRWIAAGRGSKFVFGVPGVFGFGVINLLEVGEKVSKAYMPIFISFYPAKGKN